MAMTTPDGHIYSLPRINDLAFRENPDNMFINKTWLDKLGLQIPTTTDDFYEVLKAIKENDLNGNGEKDEIPFSFIFNDGNSGIGSLFGSFGVLDHPGTNHLMVQDDKVLFAPVQPGFKEGLKYFNKLYSEGLIDPESFTQDTAQYIAKGNGEDMLYGVFLQWFASTVVGTERAANDYVPLAPLKGPDGHQMWNRLADQSVSKGHFLITPVNEHPEATMRWVDGLFDEEFSLEWSRGPIGTNLQKNPDGTYSYLPTPEGMSYNEFRFQNAPGGATAWAVLNETYMILEMEETNIQKMEIYENVYKQYFPKQVYPNLYYTLEQEERLSVLRTDIHSYVDQMVAKFIVGEESIDAQWDNYVNQLNKMGLEELMQIYQDALDVYNSNK